jgi:hypothetical protein
MAVDSRSLPASSGLAGALPATVRRPFFPSDAEAEAEGGTSPQSRSRSSTAEACSTSMKKETQLDPKGFRASFIVLGSAAFKKPGYQM